MKHKGYGKVVELPKVNDFMGWREKEKGGGGEKKRNDKKMRGKGSGNRGCAGETKNKKQSNVKKVLAHNGT